MSTFTTELVVTPLPNGREWRVVEPFEYHAGTEDSGEFYVVPKGFITDFASVPRMLWWLFPPWGRYGKAAVLHDYLYRTLAVPRLRADCLMLEAMVVLKVPWLTRRMVYRGVRMGGWLTYNRYVEEKTTARFEPGD